MVTRTIPPNGDLYKKILSMLDSRVKMARASHSVRCQAWSEAEDQVVAYIPETDSDASRRQRRENGEPVFTTLSIPYTYAQVMAAHTYWTSVFFARTPIHQFAGINGEGEQQVLAMEALIDYQVQVGGMMGPYYIWLYDAAKYGCGILGSYWDNNVVQYSRVEEQPGPVDPITGQPGPGQLVQTTQRIGAYEGNCGYNISPFDFIHDPRVPLGQFQKGEFVIVKKQISWNDVVKRKYQGIYTNLELLTGNGLPQSQDTGPKSTSSLVRPEDSLMNEQWRKGFGAESKHPARIYAYEIYVELIPKEWGLGGADYPEKWVFTTTQDMSVLFGCEPLGAIHGMFPFDVAEPEVEAYATYNRGIPEMMRSVQDTMDWLLNTHFFNVRASLNNQFIGDPSMIYMKDVNMSGQPGFFYRLRPSAYGQDVRKAIMQLPVQDITRANMVDLQTMQGIGERILGVNDTILGAMAGGRKSATEVRTTTGFGISRLKTIAEYLSATAFGPHSQKLVMTSQQYYDGAKKLRIVGDAAQTAGPAFLQVSPDMIAGQYSFVPVDGTLPIDRLAQANLWKEIMMSFRFIPQLMQMYDLSKIFAYTAQVAGLKNINQFRIQIADPQVLQAQMQAGNVIPMRPRTGQSGGPPSASEAGLPQSLPSPDSGGAYG